MAMRGAAPGGTVDAVCILHGGFPVPRWLADGGNRIHLTLNDPEDHPYDKLPAAATVTRNAAPRGFAQNVNAALRTVFGQGGRDVACLVNFDVDAGDQVLGALASALVAEDNLAAVGAVLSGPDGAPTFSVGTRPTPVKEALRAAGLRAGAALRVQRMLLRRAPGWAARNAAPPSGMRVLAEGEYLPMTCLAVSRRAWEAVGELDERFPLYAEDIDWSLRCHRAGWRLAVADCGPVVHAERATRGPGADALYEYSQLELHRKWRWDANLRWQRRALAARGRWPLRQLTSPLDWSVLTNVGERPDG